MVELNIKQRDIEILNRTYNHLTKKINTSLNYCLEHGLRPLQEKDKYITDHINTYIKALKNDKPIRFSEKIENDFIDLGHFCGGTIGFLIMPISYSLSPKLELHSIIEPGLFLTSCIFTCQAGKIPGAYAGKKLAYIPKLTIDNIFTPTYDMITDKINTATNKIYNTIKENIEITIK